MTFSSVPVSNKKVEGGGELGHATCERLLTGEVWGN